MIRGWLSLAALLLIGAIPANAQVTTAEEHGELVAGECSHPSREVTTWFFLLDYGAVGSIGCQSARIDWSGSITFYSDAEGNRLQSRYRGTNEKDHVFDIAKVEDPLVGRSKVRGSCRMVMPEDVGPRRILCFSRSEREQSRFVALVDFTFADPPWPAEGDLVLQGKCTATPMAKEVLKPMIFQATGQLPDATTTTSLDCASAQIVVGQQYAFTDQATGDTYRFLGKPRGDSPASLQLERLAFPDGTTKDIIAGACITQRDHDGRLLPSCYASIDDPANPTLIEAAMAPEANGFSWDK